MASTARTHAEIEAEVAALGARLDPPEGLSEFDVAALIGAREALLWVLERADMSPLTFCRPTREIPGYDVPMPGEAEWETEFGRAF